MKPIVSVVIPIYNKETFLINCIESIRLWGAREDEIELILVDDGSPDRCGQICEDYSAKFSWIRTIHQKNAGVSAARNVGIENSKGKFLLFVDADDELIAGTFSDVKEAIQRGAHCADIYICGCQKRFGNRIVHCQAPELILYGAETDRAVRSCFAEEQVELSNASLYMTSCCTKLISKAFLDREKIRFLAELQRSEDAYFIYSCYCKADCICFLPTELYIINQDPDGALMGMNCSKTIENFKKYLELISTGCIKPKSIVPESLYSALYFSYSLCAVFRLSRGLWNKELSGAEYRSGIKRWMEQSCCRSMFQSINLKELSFPKQIAFLLMRMHCYQLVGLEMEIYDRIRGKRNK